MRSPYCLTTRITAAVLISVIAGGCAITQAPVKTLHNVNDMPSHVYGSWIYVTLKKGENEKRKIRLGGELIAVTKDTLYVAAPIFHAFPWSTVEEAKLAAFDSNAEGVVGLSILGWISAISNGWFGFLLTGPMWIVGGTIVSIDRSYTPMYTYPDDPIEVISLYARFPAGLPPAIDRSTLVMIQFQQKPFGF